MSERETKHGRVAIVHSVFEGEALTDRLEIKGHSTAYVRDILPEDFTTSLDDSNAQGAILHNITLNDESRIADAAANGKKLLIIRSTSEKNEHKEMYDRLQSLGVKILPRFSNYDAIVNEYFSMFEEA